MHESPTASEGGPEDSKRREKEKSMCRNWEFLNFQSKIHGSDSCVNTYCTVQYVYRYILVLV
jgi:hypothetical protein